MNSDIQQWLYANQFKTFTTVLVLCLTNDMIQLLSKVLVPKTFITILILQLTT